MKKEQKEVSLSAWAEGEISSNYSHYFGFTTIASIMVGLIWVVVCLIGLGKGIFGEPLMTGSNSLPWTFKIFLFWIGIFVLSSSLAFLVNYLLSGRRYKRRKNEILAENETDYWQSLRLKPILDNLSSISVSDFPVLEEEVTGTWKPFRVEHFVSESVKSQIFGQVKLNLFSLKSTVMGISRSVATPNLLDSSSVLFLRNSKGKTLRALIPSPRTTKQMIVGAMEQWFSDAPEDSYAPRQSHTHGVLEACFFSEEKVVAPISHPQMVDSLDSSCELDFDQRPTVGVTGQQIQEGVVVATALEVDGKKNIFLPTGFFQKLADGVSSAVQNVLPAPTISEAMGTA